VNHARIYSDELARFAREMLAKRRSVVIVGAGRGGWYTAKVLAHYQVQVVAWADSNPKKHGTLLGIPVMPIVNAVEQLPDACFLPSVLDMGNYPSVANTLSAAGAEDIRYLMPNVLFSFFVEIAQRSCDPEALATTISLLYPNEETPPPCRSPSVSCVVTEKCTLNCKDCGAFVPDNTRPTTYSASRIVDDIEKYCSAFDVVHHIALQGGEPFMHKEIERIVEGVSRIPNLLFIDFVTNGTLVPKSQVLDTIRRHGACVIISDYGPASSKISQLSEVCRHNEIFVDYYSYQGNDWGMQTPIYPRKRGHKTNTDVFSKCVSNTMICCQIMDGKVHRCAFSNFTHKLKLIPEFAGDFVDVTKFGGACDELTEEIRSLATRKTALSACDYCPGEDRVFVPGGIQLPKSKCK
jgi:hypothetical protein